MKKTNLNELTFKDVLQLLLESQCEVIVTIYDVKQDNAVPLGVDRRVMEAPMSLFHNKFPVWLKQMGTVEVLQKLRARLG